MSRRRLPAELLTVPFVVITGLVFVVPVMYLVFQSFQNEVGQLSLENYESVTISPAALVILKNTAYVTVAVTIGCLVLGFAIAMAIQQARPIIRAALLVIVVAPFFVTVTVRIFGWLAMTTDPSPLVDVVRTLGFGTTPRELGLLVTTLALIQIFLPFTVLPILSSLAKVDPLVIRSARSLGASRWRVLTKVMLPLTVPGQVTGAVLVFAQTISSFFVPAILGGGFLVLLPNVVVNNISDFFRPNEAAAAAVLLTSISLTVMLGGVAIVHSRAGIYKAGRRTQAGRSEG